MTATLPQLPTIFKEVLWDLAAPDMFAVSISDEEARTIYQKIIENPIKYGYPCETFLDWRDAAYDAMVDFGYELND